MNSLRRTRLHGIGFFCLVAALLLTACEENLTVPEELEMPFSMYGVISPDLDTQSVRIYPVEPRLTLGDPDIAGEIRVSSTNMATGETTVWEDSVGIEENGQHEYIYEAPFRAEHETSYQILAERISDGARSVATVRVPAPVTVRMASVRPQGIDVIIVGDSIRVLKPIVAYVVRLAEGEFPVRRYEIPYQGEEERVPDGWRIEIKFARDARKVQGLYNAEEGALQGSNCGWLDLREMNINILVGNAEWDPPDGAFSRDILVQPGVLHNVENGFGFIGAGFRAVERLRLPREVIEAVCFNFYSP